MGVPPMFFQFTPKTWARRPCYEWSFIMIGKTMNRRRRNRFKFDPSNRPAGTFDKQIVALTLADGLHCPEAEPIVSAAVTGTFTATVEYTDAVRTETDWSCDASQVQIAFVDGSTLVNGSGQTEPP